MYKQTEDKYRHINMGFGQGSIYDFGCYLVSFTNGLNQKGYSFTPESMNEMLKAANAWVGPYRNYIDVDNLDNYFPNIFKGYQKIEPWNDVPPVRDLLRNNLVVVCKVDARGIGGSGTHFVLLVGEEDGVAVIHDPWTGNTEKVTVRYGNYGNILSVRIFDVYPYQQNEPPANEKDQKIKELEKQLEDQKRDYERQIAELKGNQDEAIKKAVTEAIQKRDEQWKVEWNKKLTEKTEECNNAIKQVNDDWQEKYNKAKDDKLANAGGLELLARGIGKILTGKL